MATTITPAHMAAAKERFASMVFLRHRIARTGPTAAGAADPALQRALTNEIVKALGKRPSPDAVALMLAAVQFGWMTADFLAHAHGSEGGLGEDELSHLLEVFQSDPRA